MQGRGGVAREIAHGVHVCGFPRCDAFRPNGGVEARVLSAGSAYVAAGLFESADPGVRLVGAFGTESNEGLGLGKLYGDRGLGTKVDPRCQLWCAESVIL